MKFIITTLTALIFTCSSFAQTIEQKLLLVQNDAIAGGQFKIAIQVQGTDLPVANTLGSATIDVIFDNTKLDYVDASLWAFGSALGYSRSATNNTTFIRVGILGTTVNGDGDGQPPGFDITSSYVTWVQLNFTILDESATTSLSIAPGSNAIGLFENHSNDPDNGVINNQPLTEPIVITDVPLPVELTYFTAELNDENVQLNWETATEVNNYGFEVGRQYQVASSEYQDSSNWEMIGFVEGNGTTNSPKSYSFLDENLPEANEVSYRLKQIDLDGTFSYSKVITVDISNITSVEEAIPVEYSLSQNYPNPFNPNTTIKFGLPETGIVDLKVYNILGEKIAQLINKEMSAGYHTVNFGSNSMPSGIYIYTINVESKFSSVKKMLLIK